MAINLPWVNLWHRMARLTGSLGCSRRLLAAGADASLTDDHGLTTQLWRWDRPWIMVKVWEQRHGWA